MLMKIKKISDSLGYLHDDDNIVRGLWLNFGDVVSTLGTLFHSVHYA
jgi:hypothetical protein